ncbi:MAG: TrmH family RNA methyltransferase [Polyangiales bacterium]
MARRLPPRERRGSASATSASEGFRVLVASMEGTVMPEELAKLDKVAIVFGNEHKGPTPAMRDLADGTYAVPMKGFVESLNVSVAAGITLYEATRGRRGELPDDEREDPRGARYLLTCVRDSERVVRDHLAARR